MIKLTMFFLLVAAHAVMDFPLQGHAVAVEKNRHHKSDLQKHVPWYYWLTSHALSHGLPVALITNNVYLGIAETVAHWAIDFGKCEKWYTIHVDQALHLACKLLWVYLAIT